MIHQIKVHDVDRVAREKGFRRNRKYWVIGICDDANPSRGPLVFVRHRSGAMEGFYPDQFRVAIRTNTRSWGELFRMRPSWAAGLPL